MARIRSAKPDWWTDAKMCALTRDVRFTYKGIIEVMADDEGRFLADPRLIKGQVWPLDDDITVKKVESWVRKLAELNRIVLYEVDGGKYGYIPTFLAHQKISHPTPSKLPPPQQMAPEEGAKSQDSLPKVSGNAPEVLRPDVDVDLDVDLERDARRGAPESLPPPTGSAAVLPARPKKGAPPALSDEGVAVLEHFKRRHPARRPEKDPKALRCITVALEDYGVDDLCRAIDGNAFDSWHRDKRKHDLTYVLRSPGKIDEFIAMKAAQDEVETPILLKDPARAWAMGIAR